MLIILFLHAGAVYIGALIAHLEYVDIWRAAMVALMSYVVMILLGLLLVPFNLDPAVSMFTVAAILGLGTTFGSKMVLSCDWQPAWIIGATTVVANLIGQWIFSGIS